MRGSDRVEELDEQECRRLLGAATVGRLGYTEAALPMIMPASCTVRGDDVVLVSPAGARMRCPGRGDVVVFGVDGYDPRTAEGWAVSVIGPSRLLTDEAEIATLDRLGLRPGGLREEWPYIVVGMGVLRGYRLVGAADSQRLLR